MNLKNFLRQPFLQFPEKVLLHVFCLEKGEHLEAEKFRKYICYTRCKKVDIKASEGFFISVDGEIYDGAEFRLEVVPKALKFGIPI